MVHDVETSSAMIFPFTFYLLSGFSYLMILNYRLGLLLERHRRQLGLVRHPLVVQQRRLWLRN
jgi:hypothetical protein